MPFISQTQVAASVPFDNTSTGLTSTNVQDAIDEIQTGIIIGLPTHAITHLPNGIDPITTATAVSTSTTNAEGTANSLARSDHTHNTVIANANAFLNTTTTTTSATLALLNGMQVTVPSNGDYIIIAGAQARTSTDSVNISFAIYVDTTQVSGTLGVIQQDRGPSDVTYSMSVKQTLTAGQTVSIYWARSLGTATARARSITIMRVG